jgi:hypothetical protein
MSVQRVVWTVAALTIVVAVATQGIVSAWPLGLGTAAAQEVFDAKDDGVRLPVLVREVKPEYTRQAMEAGIAGRVVTNAVVLVDGTVGDVTVTHCTLPCAPS